MLKLLTVATLSGVMTLGALSLAAADEAAGVAGNEAYPHVMIEKPSLEAIIPQQVPDSAAPPLQEGRASAEGTATPAPTGTLAPGDSWAARNGEAAIRELDQQLSHDD